MPSLVCGVQGCSSNEALGDEVVELKNRRYVLATSFRRPETVLNTLSSLFTFARANEV